MFGGRDAKVLSGPLLVIPGAVSAGPGSCFSVAASLSSETPKATSAPLQDNIHVVCLVHPGTR